MNNLQNFNATDKIQIIKIAMDVWGLWNDYDQIKFGEIRNQNLMELLKRALTKRGYYILEEEIDYLTQIISKK
jgi:hypothetical protein